MIPLTFFPIAGGFYACLHIFGALVCAWELVFDLAQNPTTLDVIFMVETIVTFVAHVFLIIGILKEKIEYVKAFKMYFLVFVAQLSVLIIIRVLSLPNQPDYFWLELTLIYMVIFGLPMILLAIWILNGIIRYVEHECENNSEPSYDKQILV